MAQPREKIDTMAVDADTDIDHQTATAKAKRTKFLDLAAEVRNDIYADALRVSSPKERIAISRESFTGVGERWNMTASSGSLCVALDFLRVSKQVRAEALPVFWIANYFTTYISPDSVVRGLTDLGLSRNMLVHDLEIHIWNKCELASNHKFTVTSSVKYGELATQVIVDERRQYEACNKRYNVAPWTEPPRREAVCHCTDEGVAPLAHVMAGGARLAHELETLTGVRTKNEVSAGYGLDYKSSKNASDAS